MQRAIQFLIASLAMASGAGWADSPDMCKSICATEKQECRAMAEQPYRDGAASLFEMKEKNPNAKYSGEVIGAPGAKQSERSRLVAERADKVRQCDEKALRCSRACSAPPPKSSSPN